MELPPLDGEEAEQCLGWHALNYRTAHTLHAQEMWEELEKYVKAWGEQCILLERERAAKVCESVESIEGLEDYGYGYEAGAGHCAAAIRKG